MSDTGERALRIGVRIDENGQIECVDIYGIDVCIGDYVQVYPRSMRLVHLSGIVKRITTSTIVIENEENEAAIRLSEIRLLRKPKLRK